MYLISNKIVSELLFLCRLLNWVVIIIIKIIFHILNKPQNAEMHALHEHIFLNFGL